MKKFVSSIWNYIVDTDKLLWILIIVINIYSLTILTGLLNSFPGKGTIDIQLISICIGLVLMVILSKIDYVNLASLWKIYTPIGYAFVMALQFFGQQREGSDNVNWFYINLPGDKVLSMQPTEILKVTFLLAFALHLAHVGDKINQPAELIKVLAHGMFPVLLIRYFGDDGMALVFLCMVVGMIFAAGLSWKYIATGFAGVCILAPIMWFSGIISEYQKRRILIVFYPESDTQDIGFQQIKSLISIGSGMLTGSGLNTGEHMHVPEMENDFIFSFIGQSLGFIGCITVLILILALCIKILAVTKKSNTSLGYYICIGVFSMILSQTVINVGMDLMILPVIGITLPFFSKGGTSIISLFISIGLILSVYMHSKKDLFNKKR